MKNIFQKLLKIFLHLTIILKYPLTKDDQEIAKLMKFYNDDRSFCPQCFPDTFEECLKFDVEFDDDFVGSLNNLFGVKQTRYGRLKENNSKIVAKYLGISEKFNYVLGEFNKNVSDLSSHISENKRSCKILKKLFFDKSRIDGSQFCAEDCVDDFLRTISGNRTLFSTWIHLNVNIQPLLLPILNKYKFPVPTIYGACGFTIFESYEGLPLVYYYRSPFELKIKIAYQLLEAAFKFTEGFEGYKLYLTDINPDNIVYNDDSNKVSFIDLDNVIIVDSLYKEKAKNNFLLSEWDIVHKHEIIECDGCFAYVPSEICSHYKSDLNVYAICQLLREDLYGDITKGFLYPIPADVLNQFPEFTGLLDTCVKCDENCRSRFESADKLLSIIKRIIF